MTPARRVLAGTVLALCSCGLLASPAAAAQDKAGKEKKPKKRTVQVVYQTSGNSSQTGDAGDVDAVTYLCLVYKNKGAVTCGTVSN